MIDPIKRGDTIGRFVVLSELGRGGMGVVLSAYDPELDRRIALKILHSQSASSTEARTRMLREAKAMAKLRHPNAVTVYEVGTHGEQVFLAMEFAEGGSLVDWLTKPRSSNEVLMAFVAAGRGLAAAHTAGMVHRDFKPGNVLIGADGRVQVTDFGLVGTSSGDASGDDLQGDANLTQTGAVLGTPAYMSPEQHGGEGLDARTDQFSFCVALWEALYGERPFPGRNIAQIRAALVGDHRPTPPSASRVPKWLVRILRRGLERDPNDRFASMDKLLEELDRDEGDAEIGRATRIALAALLGAIWTLPPLFAAVTSLGLPTMRIEVTILGILAAIALALSYLTRDSMGASVFNRQARAVVLFIFVAQFALIIGIHVAGRPPAVLFQVTFFSWFMITSMSVLLIERRMVPTALTYYGAFLAVGYEPQWLWWSMVAGNAMLTLNCLWIWRPRAGVLGRFPRRTTQNRGLVSRTLSSNLSGTLSNVSGEAQADTAPQAGLEETQLATK